MDSPLMTCLVVSHDKLDYCREAIDSLLGQTYHNWHAVVMDSGVLHDKGYFDFLDGDDRVEVVTSGETDETRKTRAMAPWCFNECYRRGLVLGDLVTYLCDDDIWYENAFATFARYWQRNPKIDAMYASQDMMYHSIHGERAWIGERRARTIKGRGELDCQVDYLQFCHTRRVLQNLRGTEYWPEGKATETHADGVFMEKIAAMSVVVPLDIKVSQNRRTPASTYQPAR